MLESVDDITVWNGAVYDVAADATAEDDEQNIVEGEYG